MKYRYKPEDVAHYLRWQERIMAFAEKVPSEAFKWLGWATAIAAVQVVDIRLKSPWLQVVPIVLSLLLVLRVQWFLGLKYPETMQPDGSLEVDFKLWKTLLSIPAAVLAYYLAFGVASLLATSDLLPPPKEVVATTESRVTPQGTTAAPPHAPPKAIPESNPAATVAPTRKP